MLVRGIRATAATVKCDISTSRQIYFNVVLNKHLYTVFRKKTPIYIFNYNSGISWSIYIFFVPVKEK